MYFPLGCKSIQIYNRRNTVLMSRERQEYVNLVICKTVVIGIRQSQMFIYCEAGRRICSGKEMGRTRLKLLMVDKKSIINQWKVTSKQAIDYSSISNINQSINIDWYWLILILMDYQFHWLSMPGYKTRSIFLQQQMVFNFGNVVYNGNCQLSTIFCMIQL
jgi:hypothetical protein